MHKNNPAHSRQQWSLLADRYNDGIWFKEFVVLPHLRRYFLSLGNLQGKCVLDLACGAGDFSHWLTQQGAEVIGVDPSAPMLRRARQNAPLAKFLRGTSRDLAIVGKKRFDVVLAAFLFCNISSRRLFHRSLQEIYARLKPGGALIICDRHPAAFRALVSPVLRVTMPRGTRYVDNGTSYRIDVLTRANQWIHFTNYHWSIHYWVSALNTAGFRLLAWEEMRPAPKIPALLQAAFAPFHQYPQNMLIVCRKAREARLSDTPGQVSQ